MPLNGACRQATIQRQCVKSRGWSWALSLGAILFWTGTVVPFLVHAELCHRAGFAINWNVSRKGDYLESLTRELENPQGKHLDAYLLPLMAASVSRGDLRDNLLSLPGLNGEDGSVAPNIAYRADDAEANQNYLELKRARGEN